MSTEAKSQHDGHMTIRRALFLGGAVMVLAACSDSTAPMASAKKHGSMAATKQPAPTVSTTTSMFGDCRTGYTVASGKDTTSVPSDSTCAADQ